jgi:hypothetical protein
VGASVLISAMSSPVFHRAPDAFGHDGEGIYACFIGSKNRGVSAMSQGNPTQERCGGSGRWKLVILCLGMASLLLFCALGTVWYSFWKFPRILDSDPVAANNGNDIIALNEAIVNFETMFNVDYLPSRIRLLDSGEYDLSVNQDGKPNSQLDYDSYNYLTRLWPRLSFPVDWNSNGNVNNDVTLEGDQCLVFFLGGPNGQGFSNNQRAPASLGGSREGPLFEFMPSRLTARPNGYFVYLDAYGKTPFAYFSSYKTRNGYNRYGTTDCKSIPDGPYHDGAGSYYNSDRFQIISAGADTRFGRGGQWTPSRAKDTDPDGRDDVSNFHPTLLGKPN